MKNTLNTYYQQTETVIAQLLPDNRAFFENIQEYMLLSSFFRDEIAVRQLILQLALDLQAAEADGISAVDYFGDNPKQMVDELMKESQVASKMSLAKLVGVVVGILCYFRFWSDFASHGVVTLTAVGYLSDILFGTLGVALMVYLLKRSIYRFAFLKKKWIRFAFLFGMAVAFIGVISLKVWLEKWLLGPSLTLSALMSLALAIALLVVGILVCSRDKVFRPMIAALVGFVLCGLLKLWTSLSGVSHPMMTTVLPIVIIVACLLIFYRLTYQVVKEDL